MKGGLTPEEVEAMKAAWQHVLTADIADLSAGLLLEFCTRVFLLCCSALMLQFLYCRIVSVLN